MSAAFPAAAGLALKPQEIPVEHPDSSYSFRRRLHATPAAIEAFGVSTILRCHELLMAAATRHDGLDYLQVFEDPLVADRRLWFIDDGPDGVVTALLPEDY